MTKVLIAFYSRTGSTLALAKAVADGAEAAGATVRLRRAREVVGEEVMAQAPGWIEAASAMNQDYPAPTPEDAVWADAIILGSPSRFGMVSSELKAYLDSLGGLWAGNELKDKVGSAFSTTSARHGGNELTISALFTPMAHLGLIIVPLGYTDPAMFEAGTPYGATAIVDVRNPQPPGDKELAAARYQGARVARIAGKIFGGS